MTQVNEKIIPYGRQHITDDDIAAVVKSLRSDYLTQGPEIARFEHNFAAYVDAPFALSVANGTAALHLSVLALGLQPGQKVITTTITFSATANAVRYAGADVHFVDIAPATNLIDIAAIRQLLADSPKGTYAGIISVDFAGRAVNLQELRLLADAYDMWIISDSCHAPGAYFIDEQGREQLCGNGRFADLTVFSFHPVKHIASGEGGMVTTRHAHLYQQLSKLRTHGITRAADDFLNSVALAGGGEDYPAWYMEMQELGFNYRLTDLQAALGNSQLQCAAQGLVRRRALAAVYTAAFTGKDYVYNLSGDVGGHAYHLYVLEVKDRLGLYNYLRRHHVFAQVHYFPVHLMPYYQAQGWREGDLPQAEAYYKNCLSLPLFPTLSDSDQERVIQLIESYYVK
ncbi:UDP-4-amino-4,6-dideoxy-N-acetyl-beta-L-altrosamine transaminase [Sphingobacterium sp. UT-1RO-CII-1]|uniref:UDP-4-amino-4, 6-dideoxy-N-acetyl-beta-L-altrosamine transaminase n=1 Tax=Sphingobacterium sp. UT-1RO-CII-1 TaxID=2995225 RepID=UPI00227C8BEB|nr:UDP-4-amino-4,6-dideoxy-N-acetyl-beta-L-altrosamine transaminase [Sphingobacterium sp. UT-1RO-CII-1]MCY4780816.1 UDP-4-amino-4,6-dideoxy-N-acetyl-beta-L-altrosamine transaminase [Sphingobacterium sp. UT-1RO-CII-1]